MRKLILKSSVVEHANGKSVPVLRDFSLQAGIVNAALRRKRKNDVRNSKAANDLPIDSADPNIVEPVLPSEGGSEGSACTRGTSEYTYNEDGIKASAVGPSERFEYVRTPITKGTPRIRVEWADGGVGLCEPDGVGRVQEPAVCGDGGDSSLGNQSL